MHKCKSSNIDWIDYDTEKNLLKVKFLNGTEYHYDGVSQKDYDSFKGAKSHGTHLAKNIKSKFKHKLHKEDKDAKRD